MMKLKALLLLALLFAALFFARAAESEAEAEVEAEAEAEAEVEEQAQEQVEEQAKILESGSMTRCEFSSTVKANWNVPNPACNPGYTNAHPGHDGRCFASFETAAAWCDKDPNCDSVSCSSWLGGKASGCEPRSLKGLYTESATEGQDSYMCTPVPTVPTVTAPGNKANYVTWHSEKVFATGFEFKFNARASNDIHVAFMCEKAPRNADAWEVVIGGWGNSRSVIRAGTQGRELAAVGGSAADGEAFKTYTVWYSVGKMIVKDGDSVLMTVNDLPAPSCGRMFIGLGGWNSEVEFQIISVSASSAARGAYGVRQQGQGRRPERVGQRPQRVRRSASVQVDVFGNKIKAVPRAQEDVDALRRATKEKKAGKIEADARLKVANQAAQEAADRLKAAREDAFQKSQLLSEHIGAAQLRLNKAKSELKAFEERAQSLDDAATKALLDEKERQQEEARRELERLRIKQAIEKEEQAKLNLKLQRLVDMAAANAARAAYLAQDAEIQYTAVVGMTRDSDPLVAAKVAASKVCARASKAKEQATDLKDAVAKAQEAVEDSKMDAAGARKAAEANPGDAFAHSRRASALKNFAQAQKNFAQTNRDYLKSQDRFTSFRTQCENAQITLRTLKAEKLKREQEEARLAQAALVKAAAEAAAIAAGKAAALQRKCQIEILEARRLLESNRKALEEANNQAEAIRVKNAAIMQVAEAERRLRDAKSEEDIKQAQASLGLQQQKLSQAAEAAELAVARARVRAEEAEAARVRADAAERARLEAERAKNDKIIADMEAAQDQARRRADDEKRRRAQAILDMADRDLRKQRRLEERVERAEAAVRSAEADLSRAQNELEERKSELRTLEMQLRDVEKLLEIAYKELALAQTEEALQAARAKVKTLKARVADLTVQVDEARKAVVAAGQVVAAKYAALKSAHKALRDAEDAENKRAQVAAQKLADAERQREEEKERVRLLNIQLQERADAEKRRKEEEYNAQMRAATLKLQQLQQAEAARRAELQVIEGKIIETQRQIDEATRVNAEGKVELLRLLKVQQENEAARKQEEARLAQVAVDAQQKSIEAANDLLQANRKLHRVEKENREKMEQYKKELEKKTQDLNEALALANTNKLLAEQTWRALVAAKASQAEIEAAQKAAEREADKADNIRRVAESAAAQLKAEEVRLQALHLAAKLAAEEKEAECRRLFAAAWRKAATAEGDAKKASDDAAVAARTAAEAASKAQELANIAAEWTRKAIDAGAESEHKQAEYNAAQGKYASAQKIVDQLTTELTNLQNNPPPMVPTDELIRRISMLRSRLAQAKQDWEDAKRVLTEAKAVFESQRQQEETAIEERRLANQRLREQLTVLNRVQKGQVEDAELVQKLLGEIKIKQTEAQTAKKNAQISYDQWLAAFQVEKASEDELRRLEGQVSLIGSENAAAYAAAQANLAELRRQVTRLKVELREAKKDLQEKQQTLKDKEAELRVKRSELDTARAAKVELKKRKQGNWRSVHQARNEYVGEFGRAN